MDRTSWRRLSLARQREAKLLLDAEEYAGAYYLLGYAVECALKACIVRALPPRSMPDRKTVAAFYTHELEQLLTLAELRPALNADAARRVSWAKVKDWSEQARYREDVTAEDARALYDACVRPGSGVLPWLRKYW